MPVKNQTKRPQHQIDEAVKRYMDGEAVTTLAKYYKISRPAFYLWIQKAKNRMLETNARADLTPKEAELADKRVLATKLEQLQIENRKLRDKVVSMMVKYGEM
jgi:hypothetical protein